MSSLRTPRGLCAPRDEAAPSLALSVPPALSLARQQAGQPPLQTLVVRGAFVRDYARLILHVRCEPPLFRPLTWDLDELPAGCVVEVDVAGLTLVPQRLQALPHNVAATVHAVVQDDAGEVLAAAQAPTWGLAPGWWEGVAAAPTLLAAHVCPEAPAVQALLAQAASCAAANAGRSPVAALPATALLTALCAALAGKRLAAAPPPDAAASPALPLRPAAEVMRTQRASALEIAAIVAAALEASGAAPVVAFAGGRTLVGTWASPAPMDAALTTDLAQLRNHVAAGALSLVDAAHVRQAAGDAAIACTARAHAWLQQQTQATFGGAVDVLACRARGVLPLVGRPAVAHGDRRTAAGAAGHAGPTTAGPSAVDAAPAAASALRADAKVGAGAGAGASASASARRLQAWKNELLDLGRRNPLLNVQASRRALRLVVPQLAPLLAALHGPPLQLQPWEAPPPACATDAALHRQQARDAAVQAALGRRLLYVDAPPPQVAARLTELYRRCRAWAQEGGANVLYVALGLLMWRRPGEATSSAAPLLLLPVRLTRAHLNAPFALQAEDGAAPRLNPTLCELLRREFGLQLPLRDDALAAAGAALALTQTLQQVRRAIGSRPGWEVLAETRLGLFDFARFAMWRDLDRHADLLPRNRVVDHLLHRPLAPYPAARPLPQAADLDAAAPEVQVASPLPADSSQTAAVQAAVAGHDLVLVGPPGTGKSQTIVNLVAQCLAAGKRVLVVSAKAEALSVVHRRLTQLGLGPACLALHRADGAKAAALRQLRAAWEAPAPVRDAAAWDAQLATWQQTRAQLAAYAQALHAPASHGMTPFAAMALLATAQVPAVALAWPDDVAHDAEASRQLHAVADALALAAEDAAELWRGPLRHVRHARYDAGLHQSLRQRTDEASAADAALQRAAAGWRQVAGIAAQLDVTGRASPADRAHDDDAPAATVALAKHVDRAGAALLQLGDDDWDAAAGALRQAHAALAQQRACARALPPPWPEADCTALHGALRRLQALRCAQAALAPHYPTLVTAEGGPQSAAALQAAWRGAAGRRWPMAGWQRRRVLRQLQALRLRPAPPLQRQAELDALVAYENHREAVRAYVPPPCAGALWQGEATDVEALHAALQLQGHLAGLPLDPDSLAFLAPVAKGRCGRAMAQTLRASEAAAAAAAHAALYVTGLGRLQLAPALLQAARGDDPLPALAATLTAYDSCCALLAAAAEAAPEGRRHGMQALARSLRDPDGPARLRAAGLALQQAAARAEAATAGLQKALGAEPAPADAADPAAAPLHPDVLRASLPRLRPFCPSRRARTQARAAGLAPLVAAIEAGHVRPKEVRDCFARSYAAWWLAGHVRRTPVLRDFTATAQAHRQAQFAAADAALAAAAATRTRQRCHAKRPVPAADQAAQTGQARRTTQPAPRPAGGQASPGDAWGQLSHALYANKGAPALRQLFATAGPAIAQLTPCLLMSPLAVAQLLPMTAPPFDLVVFDEASQLRVSEAVGVMARARQVIMVGDPQQMPPTNFFGRSGDTPGDTDGHSGGDLAGDDAQAGTQAESVLDLCLAARLPKHTLRWHYRSRHEALIAFANAAYYDDALLTFCSADDARRAVAFHLVADGAWRAGSARCNPTEARALVAHLVARIRDGSFAAAGHTVGVIAFNLQQARRIEDLLERAGRHDEAVAQALAPQGPLQLFVKNLESVQGDERDVIYLSVAYAAATPGGPVPLRFGPLNLAGGERRLNVAVTRARQQMYVFGSFAAEALPDSKLRSQGARDLKRFLAYAQHAGHAAEARATPPASSASAGDEPHGVAHAAAQALRQRGWVVDVQVGRGTFRVDLAVRCPRQPDRYVAAILCDAAAYRDAATVRDRDKTWPAVLQSLGWKVLRLWSVDWLQDADAAAARLHAQLQGIARA